MKSGNVFVTGGTGRIGRHLVRRLVDCGYQVKVLTRKDRPPLVSGGNIQFIKGDILNQDLIRKEIKGCDYLFHLAVYQNINDGNKGKFIGINVEGTKVVLNCSINAKLKKIVYVSTAMVFESTGNVERDENWPQKTFSKDNYVQTKIEALKIAREAKKILPIVTVYPSEVIDLNDFASSLPARVKKCQKALWEGIGGGIPGGIRALRGSKNRIINYVVVEDLVEGVIQAAETGYAGEEYILCGENIKVKDYLYRALNRKHKKRFFIRIPPFPFKAIGLLGRFISIPPIIKSMLEHCQRDACFSSEKAKKNLGYNQRLKL